MTSCGFGLWMKMSEEKFAPVPLTAVSVKVSIINLVAEVQVEQSYWNEASHPIEVVYKFPLTGGANMFKFNAEINGREISSKVKVSVDEETDYEEYVRRGPSAFMMEEKLSDIFMVELGDVAAKSSANIRVKYITKLAMEGDEFRFMLPWAIAPRYVQTEDESVITGFWSRLFSKTQHTQEVSYELKFEADVLMPSVIKDIRSPTHDISMSHVHETKRTVTLSDSTATMDGDLLFFVTVENPYEGSLVLEDSVKGSSALMLCILPKFKPVEPKAELIFVIDRSSSMNGAGIHQAKRALQLFLHSLSPGCYVNVVAFGSKHHFLFPDKASRKYDPNVLKLAKEYAEAMDADLGESEIMDQPLKAIFELPTIKGYSRKVFVITADDVVSKKDDVVLLKLSGKSRVFTIGLGCNVSRDLLEEIARAGQGTALFTSLEEGLEGKVIEQLRDALRPSGISIKVEWDGFEEEDLMGKKPLLRQAPSNGMIPSLVSGKPFMVYALVKDGAYIPQEATLTVSTPKKKILSVKVYLNPSMTTDGSLIHRMAAKKLIQGLQDRSNETSKKQIIKLASTYGLVSPHTSFVAVDPRKPDKTLKGSPILLKSTDVADCLSSAMSAISLKSSSPVKQKSYKPVSTNTKKEEVKEPLGEEKMMEVICLQKFNGSFDLGGTLSKIIDSSWIEILGAGNRAKCPGFPNAYKIWSDRQMWNTLLAVSYFQLGLPQFRDSWTLVVEKANNWLSSKLTQSEETRLKKEADKFMTAKLKL